MPLVSDIKSSPTFSVKELFESVDERQWSYFKNLLLR